MVHRFERMRLGPALLSHNHPLPIARMPLGRRVPPADSYAE